MALQPIEANINSVESVVAVTAAMGSAGQALTPAITSSIRLARGAVGGPVEYRVGAGGWIQLDSNEGVDLPVDLSATVVMLRKATTTSAAIPVALIVRSVATTAAPGQVPALPGGATPITISGVPFVGNKLTAAIAAGWQNASGNWMRNGVAIAGANALEYTLVPADVPGPVTYKSSNLPYMPPGLPVAAAPVVPVAPAITTAPTLSGGGAVGQPLTLTPGTVTGSPAPVSTFSWRDAGGNELSTSASAFTPVATGQITVVQTASNGVGPAATRMSNTVTVVPASADPYMIASHRAKFPYGGTQYSGSTFLVSAVVHYAPPYVIKSPRALFVGYFISGTNNAENNFGNSLEYSGAWIEVGGVRKRLTVNGSNTFSVPQGANVFTDPDDSIVIPAGQRRTA